jgi:bacteriocin-like protein
MKELNDKELEQVVGGSHSSSTGAGGANATGSGVATEFSNATTFSSPCFSGAGAVNIGFAAGKNPTVVSGAAADSSAH